MLFLSFPKIELIVEMKLFLLFAVLIYVVVFEFFIMSSNTFISCVFLRFFTEATSKIFFFDFNGFRSILVGKTFVKVWNLS